MSCLLSYQTGSQEQFQVLSQIRHENKAAEFLGVTMPPMHKTVPQLTELYPVFFVVGLS